MNQNLNPYKFGVQEKNQVYQEALNTGKGNKVERNVA